MFRSSNLSIPQMFKHPDSWPNHLARFSKKKCIIILEHLFIDCAKCLTCFNTYFNPVLLRSYSGLSPFFRNEIYEPVQERNNIDDLTMKIIFLRFCTCINTAGHQTPSLALGPFKCSKNTAGPTALHYHYTRCQFDKKKPLNLTELN